MTLEPISIEPFSWLALIIGLPIGLIVGSLAGLGWFEFAYGEMLQRASWRQQNQKAKR